MVDLEYKCKLLRLLGPEAPVLLLIWLLYMLALWPLALMNQVKLGILSAPMSVSLGVIFIIFSKGRGTSWLAFSSLSLTASIAGTVQGVYLRIALPVEEEDLPLKYKPALLRAVFIPAGVLLVVLVIAAPIMSRYKLNIVGSSMDYRRNWARHMIFGTAITTNVHQIVMGSENLLGFRIEESDEEATEEGLLLKLQDDLFFSGEPIYDFAFWIANNHLMLGPIFHHPLSPMDTEHRIVILITTSLLIVFPVALVTILWPQLVPSYVPGQAIVRLIFMALFVILPRNMMKARLRRITMQDEEQYTQLRLTHAGKVEVEKTRKELHRREARLYGWLCILTVMFCVLTWHRVKEDSDSNPVELLLENTDGLGFCFVLEILFALILPKPAKDREGKCFGWWGRWRSERMAHNVEGLSRQITPDFQGPQPEELATQDGKGLSRQITPNFLGLQPRELATQKTTAVAGRAVPTIPIPASGLQGSLYSTQDQPKGGKVSVSERMDKLRKNLMNAVPPVSPEQHGNDQSPSFSSSRGRAQTASASARTIRIREPIVADAAKPSLLQSLAETTRSDSPARYGQRTSTTSETTRSVSPARYGQHAGTTSETTSSGSPARYGQRAGITSATTSSGSPARYGQRAGITSATTSSGSPARFGQRAGITSATTSSGSPARDGQCAGITSETTSSGSPARYGQGASTTQTLSTSPGPSPRKSAQAASITQTRFASRSPPPQQGTRGARSKSPDEARKGVAVAQAAVQSLSPTKLQDADSTWRQYNGAVFEPVLRVHAELGESPVRLVDARFIVELEKKGGKLCRRQDLPDAAFIGLEQLKRLPPHRDVAQNLDACLRIVAISHPWHQRDHPDPKGCDLKMLAQVFKLLLAAGGNTYAVFYDYLSLPQKGPDGKRTRMEEELFNIALDGVLDWFACPWALTMKVTELPDGYPTGFIFPAGTKPNKAGYLDRGWCFSEAAASSLTKDSKLVLDLGKFSGTVKSWRQLQDECSSDRMPPITPEQFRLLLVRKSFSTMFTDFRKVGEIYKKTFDNFMMTLEKMVLTSLSWGEEEMAMLAKTCGSSALQCLKEICLDHNNIGDDGCQTFVAALSARSLPNLTRLRLGANKIGDSGCKAIADACASGALPMLEELYLFNNQIGDGGCIALAEACTAGALKNLMTISLEGNLIGESGRKAFEIAKVKGALPKCSPKFRT